MSFQIRLIHRQFPTAELTFFTIGIPHSIRRLCTSPSFSSRLPQKEADCGRSYQSSQCSNRKSPMHDGAGEIVKTEHKQGPQQTGGWKQTSMIWAKVVPSR